MDSIVDKLENEEESNDDMNMTYHVVIWAYIFDETQMTKDIVFDSQNEASNYFWGVNYDPSELEEELLDDWVDYWWKNGEKDEEIPEDISEEELSITLSVLESPKNLVPGVDYKCDLAGWKPGDWIEGSVSKNYGPSIYDCEGDLINIYLREGAEQYESGSLEYQVGWNW